MTELPQLPDVATASYEQLDRALSAVQLHYGIAAFMVTRGLPDSVPPDVAAWWLAAWHRRLELIAAAPRGPLYVATVTAPMERRRVRLRKPPPLPPKR